MNQESNHPTSLESVDVYPLLTYPDFQMSFSNVTAKQLRVMADLLSDYNKIVRDSIQHVLKQMDLDAFQMLSAHRLFEYRHMFSNDKKIPPGTIDYYLDANKEGKQRFICRCYMSIADGIVRIDISVPYGIKYLLPFRINNQIDKLKETKF